MLRKIRISLAVMVFSALTVMLLGVSWNVVIRLEWLARIQFLPAVLALDFAVLAFLFLLTLVFGRVYCSVLCPLGVMQDAFGWLGGKIKRNRFGWSEEKTLLRYSVLAVFMVCMVIGFAPVTTLLAPYGAYARIVHSLFKPLYDLLNNYLAGVAAARGSYAFTEVDIWMRSVTVPVVSAATLVVLGALAMRYGRSYCNTVCPVGTILGLVSRFALLRVRFDKNKCCNCSLCAKNCKSSAIDFKSGTIDYSRCVVCGDCIEVCAFDALSFCRSCKLSSPSADKAAVVPENDGGQLSRRSFIVGAAMAAGSAAVAQTLTKVDGAVAAIEDKTAPVRTTPVVPPGALSLDNFRTKCIACQLCVTVCPNNVLRPSGDMMNFMQPEMSFERGYCRPECVSCTGVCPTDAIRPVKREDKQDIHIGHAVWIKDNCVVLADRVSCGNCARHCPVGAINMVPYNGDDTCLVPAVDAAKCIGCGACENLCPARPFSAIYVEGRKQHIVD